MEIVCAGFPKTGTKSCSAALRHLGINVADYPESALFLSDVWFDYFHGKITIERVIEEYKRHGFKANQDLPGNFMWYELLKASPDAKVILTVRDSTDKWQKSLSGFLNQEMRRFGNPWGFIMEYFITRGYMGRKMEKMMEIGRITSERYLFPGFRLDRLFFRWQTKQTLYNKMYPESAKAYERHNAHVKSLVSSDRLLVWNIKDGWEPLCRFLNKPVPDIPIPYENKTGDTKWVQQYFNESDLGKELESEFKWNMAKAAFKLVIIGGTIVYLKETGRSSSIMAPISSIVKNYITK